MKRKEQIVEQLTPFDDTMFHKLAEDKGFCEEILQTVLNKKNITVISTQPQKSMRNVEGRSVVLDVYITDDIQVNYDVEMQKKDNDDHQKRVRYNLSNMDTFSAEKGSKFSSLPENYVIYITEKDFFHGNKNIYHVDRVLRETNEVVYNGTNEIYVNAEVKDGTVLSELMSILSSSEIPTNNVFPKISRAIKGIKTGKGSDDMCDLVEEYAKEYAEESVKHKEKEIATKLFMKGMSLEDVEECVTKMTPEELKTLHEETMREIRKTPSMTR